MKTKTKAATKKAKTAKADAKRLSQIEAAVAVLAKAGEPMNCKAMVEAMAKQGLWTSPGGATPDATLYASTCGRSTRRARRPGSRRSTVGSS